MKVRWNRFQDASLVITESTEGEWLVTHPAKERVLFVGDSLTISLEWANNYAEILLCPSSQGEME